MAFEQKDFLNTNDLSIYNTSKAKGYTKLSLVILNFIGESGDTTKSKVSDKPRIDFFYFRRPNMLEKID